MDLSSHQKGISLQTQATTGKPHYFCIVNWRPQCAEAARHSDGVTAFSLLLEQILGVIQYGVSMSLRSRISVLMALLLAGSAFAAASPKERIVWWPIGKRPLGLYLSDPDGRNERPFLTGAGPNYNPSFSSDGRWIIFTSERFGSADVFRVHPDSSGLERFTDSPAFDDQGTLSPDGRTLAFVSTRAGGTADIWLLDIASHHVRNLTKTRAGNFRPSWSPDGKWIAFSSDRDTPRLCYHRDTGPAWELMQTTAI
jgi:hypothetical protein